VTNPAAEVLNEALGISHRHDPVLPITGGPAGNARLTAWTGLVLLVLSLAELVTLLNVRGLLSWHIVVGTLLLPPALLKTFSTGWRIVRYYTGCAPYVEAGPPPLLLRILGPVVVLSTLGVLGSGLLLIGLGPDTGRQAWFSLVGHSVSALTVHQALFIVWAVAVGLHVLGRLVPALVITRATRAPATGVSGRLTRASAVVASVIVGAILGSVVLGLSSWRSDGGHDDGYPPRVSASR
jgi:hypothetical protein